MAYVPPHKRHPNDSERPSPTAEKLVPQFKRNLNLRASQSKIDKSGKIIYADRAVSKWFPVSLSNDTRIPPSVQLEPVTVESAKGIIGGKCLALVNSHLTTGNNDVEEDISRRPWVSIAENVLQDLLSSFENIRNEMDSQNLGVVKPTLIARFGRILFHGRSNSVSLESVQGSQISETTLRRLKRSFHSNLPASYKENILGEVIPKIGGHPEEKDIYHVKLSDGTQPDATLSCKCILKEDGKLSLYKVELNQVRHFLVDISCLDKNLDLRLMLCTKRILTNLTDDEMDSIKELIDSAIPDTTVKGGLRWTLGKATSGNRFSVCGVWHTTATSYAGPSLRLKVRDADRYNFRTGTGETSREVALKLKGLVSNIQEQKAEESSISEMLKDTLKLIWNHFLCCEPFLT